MKNPIHWHEQRCAIYTPRPTVRFTSVFISKTPLSLPFKQLRCHKNNLATYFSPLLCHSSAISAATREFFSSAALGISVVYSRFNTEIISRDSFGNGSKGGKKKQRNTPSLKSRVWAEIKITPQLRRRRRERGRGWRENRHGEKADEGIRIHSSCLLLSLSPSSLLSSFFKVSGILQCIITPLPLIPLSPPPHFHLPPPSIFPFSPWHQICPS